LIDKTVCGFAGRNGSDQTGRTGSTKTEPHASLVEVQDIDTGRGDQRPRRLCAEDDRRINHIGSLSMPTITENERIERAIV